MNGKCAYWCSMAVAMVAGGVIAMAAVDPKDPKAQPGGDKPAMSPQEQAMMEAWAKYATPGEHHKLLNDVVGTFDCEVTSWMSPEAPPTKSKGTMVNSWILDGRWVKNDFSGAFMEQPFTGLGFWGYDNAEQKYIGTWMDSMSTGMMYMRGTYDAKNKSFELVGEMKDPMGHTARMREIVRIFDRDKHTMTMFCTGPDGKEFKNMELVYTRRK